MIFVFLLLPGLLRRVVVSWFSSERGVGWDGGGAYVLVFVRGGVPYPL